MIEAFISLLVANPLLFRPPHVQEYNSCSLSAVAECQYMLTGEFEAPGQGVRTVPQAMKQLGANGRRVSNRQGLARLANGEPTVIVLYKWQDKGYEITSGDIWTPHAVCGVGMIGDKIVARFAEGEDVGILGHFIIDKSAIDRYYSINK